MAPMLELHTIQTVNRWELLQKTGLLHGPSAGSPYLYDDEVSLHGYDWMRAQMAQRIGPAPKPDLYPLWAWYQYGGRKLRKPDLRYSGHLPSGAQGVRISFKVAADQVLLSDLNLWHQPFVYKSYIGEGWEAFVAQLEADYPNKSGLNIINSPEVPAAIKRKITDSWERIFDLEWEHPDWTHPLDQRPIQATFWELQLDQVTTVTHFNAR